MEEALLFSLECTDGPNGHFIRFDGEKNFVAFAMDLHRDFFYLFPGGRVNLEDTDWLR